MGIVTWLKNLRAQDDAEAVRRAEETLAEGSPEEERDLRSGDVAGLAADQRAGGLAGESLRGIDRLDR
jgi:hypothetical protein